MNRRLYLVFCFGLSMSWEYVRRHIFIYTHISYHVYTEETHLVLFQSNHLSLPQERTAILTSKNWADGRGWWWFDQHFFSQPLLKTPLQFNLEGWKGIWGKTNSSHRKIEHHVIQISSLGGFPNSVGGPEKWWNMYPQTRSLRVKQSMWSFFFSRSPLKQVHHGGVEKFHFGFQGVYVCTYVYCIHIYICICTYGSPRPSVSLDIHIYIYICMSTTYRLHIASIHENTQGWKSSPWRQCPYILRCGGRCFRRKFLSLAFSFPSKRLDAPNSIKNQMGPYQRTPRWGARAIRYSGLGVRSAGPVGDFLDTCIQMYQNPFLLTSFSINP